MLMCGVESNFKSHQYIHINDVTQQQRGDELFDPLCAEASSGYLLNFQVYIRKKTTHSANGVGFDVVRNMVQGHFGKNYTV